MITFLSDQVLPIQGYDFLLEKSNFTPRRAWTVPERCENQIKRFD